MPRQCASCGQVPVCGECVQKLWASITSTNFTPKSKITHHRHDSLRLQCSQVLQRMICTATRNNTSVCACMLSTTQLPTHTTPALDDVGVSLSPTQSESDYVVTSALIWPYLKTCHHCRSPCTYLTSLSVSTSDAA